MTARNTSTARVVLDYTDHLRAVEGDTWTDPDWRRDYGMVVDADAEEEAVRAAPRWSHGASRLFGCALWLALFAAVGWAVT